MHQATISFHGEAKKMLYFQADAYTYVFIQQLLKDGLAHKRGDMQTQDWTGKRITIEGRSKAGLRKMFIEGDIDISTRIRNPITMVLKNNSKAFGFHGLGFAVCCAEYSPPALRRKSKCKAEVGNQAERKRRENE